MWRGGCRSGRRSATTGIPGITASWPSASPGSPAACGRRGLAPGDRVLLSLENCGEFFELLFGCWAAGLCAVPANARLHPREVEYIAEQFRRAAAGRDARPCRSAGAARRHGRDAGRGHLDPHRRITTRCSTPSRCVPEPGSPTDRAWLFYTSGTTGRPKGAVLTHRNLLFTSQCYYADIDRLDERDTHLLAAPVSHGAGLYALPFLLKGAHQIVLPHFDVADDPRGDPAASARLVLRRADDADPARPRARGAPAPTSPI